MPAFDPYYKWLGISPKDQPPNHYRLLGVDEFEPDADVIAAAADRQMAYVRQCASGEYADAAQKLLGELATARLALLNPQKKEEYDALLRWQVRLRDEVSSSQGITFESGDLDENRPLQSPSESLPASAAGAGGGIVRHGHSARSTRVEWRSSWLWPALILSGATGLLALIVWIAARPGIDRPAPDDVAKIQSTDRPSSKSQEQELASAPPIVIGEMPGDSKPGELQPAEAGPAQPEPDESKPGQPGSTAPEPASPEPAEPKSTAAKPTEPTPAEMKPAETKPAEPQPAEPQPAEPQPPEPQPPEPEPEPTEPEPDEPDSKDLATTGTPPVKVGAGRTRADLNGQVAGEEWSENGLQFTFCWCPPGEFTMGSPPREEGRGTIENQASVRLTDGFWLGQTEVTQSQWFQLMQTSPWKQEPTVRKPASAIKRSTGGFPATFVSWEDAMEFCRRFTAREQERGRLPLGWKYVLPTEAQWEYACRAGRDTTYFCGKDASQLGKYAWFRDTTSAVGKPYAHPVGQKKPNAWGLHDMHGNVWEWCRDSFHDTLPGGANPFENIDGRTRATRGGGWNDLAERCRSANRDFSTPGFTANNLGFRVAIVRTRE